LVVPDVGLCRKQILNGEPCEYHLHGEFIVVGPGDRVAALEKATSVAILGSYFADSRFPHRDFVPGTEAIEDHGFRFEVVYVLNNEGFGIGIFVPKREGIDSQYSAVPLTRRHRWPHLPALFRQTGID